ncbi:PAS fold-containing protein [Streptomyces sp. OV198]|uniref:SpoIIE family protein phosphatase n=1 Tax=unclassified Streptomyces TaxID=2593676 RepID=UPI000BB12F41|nr:MULTISPECIES: SpoIIE family protein phosphatase [unclassified Streptomyces]PBD02459.1 PAS domain-containing protein [Streptomyces sp. Ag82_O1-15]SOE79941.1 PAS fold-containing protein [Streptomyces sp. OV198]
MKDDEVISLDDEGERQMDASDELLQMTTPSALLTLDGAIRSLNAAMARTLGRSVEQCVGRGFGDLLPASQLTAVKSLVAHAATTKTVAMRVLEFPGPGAASVVCLVEARPVNDPVGGESLVWVHSLNAGNDLGGLLIPFRLAAKAANLGLCMYSPQERELEWLGGAPALAALFPEASMSLSEVVRRVHPDDRGALRRLVRSAAARSPWIRLRFLTERDGWHLLVCRARRLILGSGGPERVFGVIRDDTKREARRRRAKDALSAERQRADEIAAFSSAVMTAVTEQEVRQVVLTRLAATFGGTGAALAFITQGRLRVSSDAGIPIPVAALHGLPLDAPSALPYVIRTGEPQFIPNQEDYIRRWPHGAMVPYFDQLDSGFAISITSLSPIGDKPLGAWLVTYDSEHHSSPDERALMGTLADLAGQALKRVSLQEARVELATALQQTMLPTLPEHLPGLEVAARYRPSRDGLDIGGDWYDAFVMPDGAVALEIGDAQGHDVDAAAFMGQVRASMRAIAAHEPGPATVLARTNELLVTMGAARFASCTMLRIDPGDGRVTGASAGHVPLLYARDDGSHSIHELPGGPVLGVVLGTEYGEETFALHEDSALVMVTDGVVEGPGLTLEAGLERAGTLAGAALHEGLNAEETADRVLDAAVAVDHLDDVAVLVIRRA